jgi:hypothetical protein
MGVSVEGATVPATHPVTYSLPKQLTCRVSLRAVTLPATRALAERPEDWTGEQAYEARQEFEQRIRLSPEKKQSDISHGGRSEAVDPSPDVKTSEREFVALVHWSRENNRLKE